MLYWNGTHNVRGSKISDNGVVIKEKAREVAQYSKINFSASNGWMAKFKKVFGTFQEEPDIVNLGIVK